LPYLSDADFRAVTMAMLHYSRDGIETELTGSAAPVFQFARAKIDEANRAYQELCEQNSKNASLRQQRKRQERLNAQECERIPPQTSASERKRTSASSADMIGYDMNNNTPLPPAGDFDAFWSAYPRKKDRKRAQSAFAKVKVPISTLLAAIETQKRSPEWQKDGGAYIPHPSTWLNGQRWEDEMTEVKEEQSYEPLH